MSNQNAFTVDSSYLLKIEENRRKASIQSGVQQRADELARIHKENQDRIHRIAATQTNTKQSYLEEMVAQQKKVLGVALDKGSSVNPDDHEEQTGTIGTIYTPR